MKKLILAALLVTGLAAAGYSQEKPAREKKTPEQRAQLMTDALSKKLDLTDKQKSEIYQINLDRAKEIEKVHNNEKERRNKEFAKAKKLFDESDKKIDRVLTDSQKKTYAELKAQRKEKVKEHKGPFKKRGYGKRGEV